MRAWDEGRLGAGFLPGVRLEEAGLEASIFRDWDCTTLLRPPEDTTVKSARMLVTESGVLKDTLPPSSGETSCNNANAVQVNDCMPIGMGRAVVRRSPGG